jgi:8-oxo-dGTP diphosphatase
MEPQIVVGAVIVEAGLVLAARRSRPADLAGSWEFPGGKVHDDEDPRDALVREVREELSASIVVAEEVGDRTPWRISEEYVLRLYIASVVRGELRPGTDHDLLRWLTAGDLESVDWLPSDRLALPAVRSALESVLESGTGNAFTPPTTRPRACGEAHRPRVR